MWIGEDRLVVYRSFTFSHWVDRVLPCCVNCLEPRKLCKKRKLLQFTLDSLMFQYHQRTSIFAFCFERCSIQLSRTHLNWTSSVVAITEKKNRIYVQWNWRTRASTELSQWIADTDEHKMMDRPNDTDDQHSNCFLFSRFFFISIASHNWLSDFSGTKTEN